MPSGIAPRLAAWQGRNRGLPGYQSGSSPAGTVTFPTTSLSVKVYLALGADLTALPSTWSWTDISNYVRFAPGISTRQGRQDWTSVVMTSAGQLTLDNRDGRFSRRNPNSPYFGSLTFNTPIWATVDPGSGPVTRMQQFVNEWPTRWDRSGKDSYVPITCAGIMRRLQQGKVLQSVLRRGIPQTDPDAYWPLEGGTPFSPVSGIATMAQTGQVQYATETGMVASDALPDFTGGGMLSAPLPNTGTTNQWRYEFVARFGTGSDTIGSADFTVPVHIVSPQGTVNVWEVLISTGTAVAQWEDTSGGFTGLLDSGIAVDDGEWHHFRFEAAQSGSNIAVTFTVDGTAFTSTIVSKTLNSTGSTIYVNPIRDVAAFVGSVGHLAYWAPYSSSIDTAYVARAYAGELATTRIRRLAAEEGVPMVCTSGLSPAMGPQPTGSLLDILRDCEAVDQGVLYETNWGLGYQSTNDRTNQPVSLALDKALRHIAVEPQPADDDQRLRNKWTASRTNGAEAVVELTSGPLGTQPGGPGLYDDSVTPNVNLDNQLSDQAGWRLHLGTVNEDRWPSIAIRLHGTPTLIPSWATMPFGGRMTFANPPSQVAPDLIDTIIEGWSERWDTESWDATLATSPYSPYVIAIVSDPATLAEVARIGSATATLGADISSGATSFSIVSGSGGLWTTDPNDFPLDVNIGGERIRLSAIAGAASPQSATVSARSVNAVVKTHTANDRIEVWRIATAGLA